MNTSSLKKKKKRNTVISLLPPLSIVTAESNFSENSDKEMAGIWDDSFSLVVIKLNTQVLHHTNLYVIGMFTKYNLFS